MEKGQEPIKDTGVTEGKDQTVVGQGNSTAEATTVSSSTKTQAALRDAFEAFQPKQKLKKRRNNAKRAKSATKISIRLAVVNKEKNKATSSGPPQNEEKSSRTLVREEETTFFDDSLDDGGEFGGFGSYYSNISEEDSFMAFYEETHEEKLPSFQEFQERLKEQALRRELALFDKKDHEGRSEIEQILSEQIKEKKAATERSVEKYRARIKNDEKRDRQRLNMLYRQRTTSNQEKVSQSMKIFQRRHQKELQNAGHAHQQRAQQRQVPEQIAAADWQATLRQIQAKQQRQLQELSSKAEDLKKKTEMDYKREQEKIRKSYEAKMNDAETSRQKLAAKLYQHFQQLRQRYLKRHLQRVVKEREELLNSSTARKLDGESGESKTFTPKEVAKTTMEEKAELNPPSPIKSMLKWVEEQPYALTGAAARHKHRKGVMSQTRRQLSVEIHNEGIWVSVMKSHDGDDKRSGSSKSSSDKEEFIAWGLQAHSFLESIVCGEIPDFFNADVFSEYATVQAGQVRCIVSDLRTSEQAASSHRAMSVRELEASDLEDIEKKCNELHSVVTEAEKACKKTEEDEKECMAAVEASAKEVVKARRCLDEFKVKFRNYLGPDGTPLQSTNPSDRQELAKAMMQYKSHLEAAMRREQSVKQKLAATRAHLQKLRAQTKVATKNSNVASVLLKKRRASLSGSQTSRSSRTKQSEAAEMDRASHRVKDVIAALRRTAGKRREQSVQKQSNSFSSAWVQSFPGVSNSLKKSLWHKIHRRRQQCILRPSEASLLMGLREHVSSAITPKTTPKDKNAAAHENELVKAEQMYLLSMHPLSEEDLSSVPPSKSSEAWAEPGCQLILDVPGDTNRVDGILPCAQSFPVLERNLAEYVSAPGRQASSLLRPCHLRCLSAPLSSFAVASSPAESSASLALPPEYTSGDPLFTTKDDMKLGYSFSVKLPSNKASSQSRRKTSTPKERQPSGSEKTGKKTSVASSAEASSSAGVTAEAEAKSSKMTKAPKPAPRKASEAKKRRNSKAPAASPRAQKRKIDTQQPNSVPAPQAASPQKRPSLGTAANVPLMANPYGGQYRQHPQQQQMQHQQQGPQQARPHPQQSRQQPTQKQQANQQQQQRQQQYSSQQVAQLRMMQQQQAASSRQVNPGFPQMQQFFAPSPLSHPNAAGGRGMPNHMQMQARSMHQQMMPTSAPPGTPQAMPQPPRQGQQQQQQQQQQGKRQNDSQNDPLFMLRK